MKPNLLVALLALVSSNTFASDWPTNDLELDKLLRRQSPAYKLMATTVENREGYQIVSTNGLGLGMVAPGPNGLLIQLDSELAAERRATVLIFEMANAFHRPWFDEIDKRAADGTIGSATEYALRMEIVEYDSFRHHKAVLEQLVEGNQVVESELMFFLKPPLKRVADYRLPYAHVYLETQAKSGHTSQYESWYARHARNKRSP